MSDFCYGWPVFNRVFRQAALMDRAMERMGADRAVAVRLEKGVAWYEARTRCIECVHDQRCRGWLAVDASLGADADFCPNAGFYASVKQRGLERRGKRARCSEPSSSGP